MENVLSSTKRERVLWNALVYERSVSCMPWSSTGVGPTAASEAGGVGCEACAAGAAADGFGVAAALPLVVATAAADLPSEPQEGFQHVARSRVGSLSVIN